MSSKFVLPFNLGRQPFEMKAQENDLESSRRDTNRGGARQREAGYVEKEEKG